jgi:acetyl-CoA acetyltransferase
MNKVQIIGVGMIPFTKPGASETYDVMGAGAAVAALKDAGIGYELIEQVYAGYVYGDSTCGQAAVYRVGLTGVPVINVNNNCSTGATALFLARQAVAFGAAECVLALGFEQMERGALAAKFTDRPEPMREFGRRMEELQGRADAPFPAQLFGGAGRAHMQAFGTRPDTFAKIAVKARRHAAKNPYAIFREELSEEQILASPMIFDPLTRLQCCPPTCGAAAVVVCTADFARKHGLKGVSIVSQALTTDSRGTFQDGDMRQVVGYDMTARAAQAVYESAGIGPEDVEVVELHDCFTTNELISYEALGLTPAGSAERFVIDGDNSYGGKYVVNPSGGLLSKGHPLGATGLAQCTELVWHLRGIAGARQVENARTALQHNIGIGGACVVTLYQA